MQRLGTSCIRKGTGLPGIKSILAEIITSHQCPCPTTLFPALLTLDYALGFTISMKYQGKWCMFVYIRKVVTGSVGTSQELSGVILPVGTLYILFTK